MLIYNAGRTRPHEKQEGVIDKLGRRREDERVVRGSKGKTGCGAF